MSPLASFEEKTRALFNALDLAEKGHLDWNDLFTLIKCSTGNCFGAPSMFQNRNVVAVVSSILHMTKDEDDTDTGDANAAAKPAAASKRATVASYEVRLTAS